MSERRGRLLDAARRLFHQYGPQKTTVGDIANAAGIGVGSVYLEFPNKDAILLALSEAGHQSVLEAVSSAWNGDGDADTRLRRALEARLEAFLALAGNGSHGADLLHCQSCAPIQRAHAAFRDAELRLFADYVTDGVDSGQFSARDPRETARALLYAYHAFSPPAVFRCEPENLRRDLRAVHELVFRGLRRR